jgi:glutamyl-tRNA reductase
MDLLLVGTRRRTAILERNRVVSALLGAGDGLFGAGDDAGGIVELAIVATCHRVELYAAAEDPSAAVVSLREYVRETTGADRLEPGDDRYNEIGLAAVNHLCRVACGLDATLVGESSPADEIRRALGEARSAGAAGVLMDRLVAGALRANARARAETRIGVGALAPATAAVSAVEHALGPLASRGVLVIGAGQVAREVASRLRRHGIGWLGVASRSARHAHELAEASGAETIDLEGIAAAVARADAVIAATASPVWLLDVPRYEDARRLSSMPAQVIVDLSVPAVIDPAIGDLVGVSFRTAADLGDILRASAGKRLVEIARVEAIAREEARRAYLQFRMRIARSRTQAALASAGRGPAATCHALALANLSEIEKTLRR